MEEQAFYSSDEDVAWGPYTIREAKRDLKDKRKISRRHTFAKGISTMDNRNLPDLCKDILKMNISNSSAQVSETSSPYFTPNETLATKSSPCTSLQSEISTYKSALESMENTEVAQQKTENDNLIQDTCKTLVGESIVLSSDDENDYIIVPKITINDMTYYEEKNDLRDLKDKTFSSSGNDVNIEEHIQNDDLENLHELSMYIDSKYETLSSSESDLNVEEHIQNYDLRENLHEVSMYADSKVETFSSLESDVSVKEDIENIISNLTIKKETMNSSSTGTDSLKTDYQFDSLNNIELYVPNNTAEDNSIKISMNSFDDSETSMAFDDTLAEMELFEKYGPDYTVPGENTEDSLLERRNHSLISSSCMINTPVHLGTSTTKIPVLKHDTFKVPVTPLKSPKTKNGRFKYVISPVGYYIRNGVIPCTKVKLTDFSPIKSPFKKNVSLINTSPDRETKSPNTSPRQKENEDAALPQVFYKSSKYQNIEKDKNNKKLPTSFEKLASTKSYKMKIHTDRIYKNKLEQHDLKVLLSDEIDQTNCSIDTSDTSILKETKNFIR